MRIADRLFRTKLGSNIRFRLGRWRNRSRTPLFWPHRRLAVGLGWGSYPDFVIIGAQKAGTKSLHEYLIKHPEVRRARRKEVHYFDLNYSRGLNWYRSFFPLSFAHEKQFITGEASPYYLFHPHAPQRVAVALPHVKIIVLLRNPIDRAFSHYQHNVKFGFEKGSFEDALAREREVLPAASQLLIANPDASNFQHRHYSYVARGEYAEQVERWIDATSRDRLLILKSEDLFGDPGSSFGSVLDFLEIGNWSPTEWRVHNPGSYRNKMLSDTRAQLHEYFMSHNRRLADSFAIDVDDWV